MKPMPARTVLLRSFAWILLLAFLVPAGGFAEVCGDCLGGDVPGCCPPSCSLCLCCGKSLDAGDGRLRGDRDPGRVTSFGDPADGNPLAVDPRDVFHVPKPFLI